LLEQSLHMVSALSKSDQRCHSRVCDWPKRKAGDKPIDLL
jgi:hypothetical protein